MADISNTIADAISTRSGSDWVGRMNRPDAPNTTVAAHPRPAAGRKWPKARDRTMAPTAAATAMKPVRKASASPPYCTLRSARHSSMSGTTVNSAVMAATATH